MECILIFLIRGVINMWNRNGVLVQGLKDKTNMIKSFVYDGINAYYQFPLVDFVGNECRLLTEQQQCRKVTENEYVSLEFISDIELYKKYIKKCHELKLDFRVLFIESAYSDEIWNGPIPKMEFLGYEYCPIPIDEQIITDIDWFVPFLKYRNGLNQYGLFASYKQILQFVTEYNQFYKKGIIGDGEMEAYICKVYRVLNINNI